MKKILYCLAAITGITVLFNSCNSYSFTQYPGFDKLRSALQSEVPNSTQQQLLAAYKPQIYIAAGAEGPVDFYADYIAHGQLLDGKGNQQANNAVMLNNLRHDKNALFEYHPQTPPSPITPSAYGGVYQKTVDFADLGKLSLTFLSYHFVFRHSGLPAGTSGWLLNIADFFDAAEDWHQLDHYTAVFIVLNGDKPLAVMLQQHNYTRTYIIGEEDSFGNGKSIEIDVAISSNELYPHRSTLTKRRAASNMSAKTVDYLIGKEDSGVFLTAHDITHGVHKVEYTLRFLSPDDAFYVFEGRLGESRLLPGRDGPPGAIYRNLPSLCPLEVALYYFYWQENDKEYADILHSEDFDAITINKAVTEKLKSRFSDALKESGLLN